MSKIPLFIPYVNRPDLLERAVRATQCPGVEVNILDNSDGPSIGIPGAEFIYRRPTVPLTFTQSQNWMLKIASGDSDYEAFYLWMHCDANPAPGSLEKLCKMALSETAKGTKWGVIFTFYDIMAAYSTEAFDAIGGYDTAFPDYCSDQDVYRRLVLAGYQRLESHIHVPHEGSATINSDSRRSRIVQLQVPYRTALYRSKWGGEPGQERFDVPWDGK